MLLSKRADDKELRFPKRVSFSIMNSDETIQALVIVPRHDVDDELFSTTLLSSGIYVDIPPGDTIVCTRKASASARRAMMDGYTWGAERTSSHCSRARKTQVSESVHAAWLEDILEHSVRKTSSSMTRSWALAHWRALRCERRCPSRRQTMESQA